MPQQDRTYQQLFRLRENIKIQRQRQTGKTPIVCTDEALVAIYEAHPQTVEDLSSIPGIGQRFIEQYGEQFLQVIRDNETDSSVKGVNLEGSIRDTLESLENKLVSITSKNRLLYLAKTTAAYAQDLLVEGRSDPRDIIWSEKKQLILADTLHPITNVYAESQVHKRFTGVIRGTDRDRREKGQENLYIGYPMVIGKIPGENFNVRAPLAFIPVTAKRDATHIILNQDTDRDCLYNTTLILAYCKFNRMDYPNPSNVIEDIKKDTFVSDLLTFYEGQGISIINKDCRVLEPFKSYTKSEFPAFNPGELYVENSIVLGNFVQFSSTIQMDFEKMLEGNEVNGLVEELLKTIDEVPADAASITNEEINTPDKDLHVSENEMVYINDLNSSQENVLSYIKKNDKLVVKGPPGTGKSQMIASLIADFACNGKTVLMVSEKKTALDVVYSRLGELSNYVLMIDDVGSKELFYKQLANMITYNCPSEPTTQKLIEISNRIDEQVKILQSIANEMYKPDAFGIEPYKLYLLNKNKRPLTEEERKKYDLFRKPDGTRIAGMTYDELQVAHDRFKNPSLSDNLAIHRDCLDKCPDLKYYPPSMSAFEFQDMVDEINTLSSEVDEFNKKGFFGRLFNKGKMRSKIKNTVSKYFGDEYTSQNTERILKKSKGLEVCDLPTYLEYDQTDAVYRQLSDEEVSYFNSLDELSAESILDGNDELFDMVLEWHLEQFASKHRLVLSNISGFDDCIKTLRDLIQQKKKICRMQMQSVLSTELSKLTSAKRGLEIRRNLEKKRKWSVNKFIRTFRMELFNSVKIWMMTPEVVSEIMPLQKGMYDLVVFDEASQMYVEKGIPAIFRAKKVVIVGDEKQLRPNGLFSGRAGNIEEEDDDIAEEDSSMGNAALEEESLLDLARFRYRCIILNFHYRLKYEELIAFSNHAFYDGRLYVAPNTEIPQKPPIEVIKTYEAVWSNNTTAIEAARVVEVLKQVLYQRTADETIGIITFNAKQRDLIDDMINDACREDPQLNTIITREINRKENGEDVGLFVKNIENVQGDERDIIIFSTTYAKDSRGRMIRQFGSLSQSGGENRINVAISRAKKKIYIVTSFDPNELVVEDVKNDGPRILKKYLQYAHAISDGNVEYAQQILHSFGDQTKPGSSLYFDSDFEKQVYDALTERGLDVDTQVGIGGYRIDLAVKRDGKYILGIECDGKLYHSSVSARERDLHRQNYLEMRGWKIVRIWSPNWWKDSVSEVDMIVRIVESIPVVNVESAKPVTIDLSQPVTVSQQEINPAKYSEPPSAPISRLSSQRDIGDRGVSVTKRIEQIKQPWGGYIRPKLMKKTILDDSETLPTEVESVSAGIIGMVVDYMTRFVSGASTTEAFRISLMGATRCNRMPQAMALLNRIKGTDDDSIKAACKLVWFDQVYRAGTISGDYRTIDADETTCEHVRIMIKRSQDFFAKYGPIVVEGPTFEGGGYTEIVRTGDGDFTTEDTIWDFKVSKNEPSSKYTLQLAMYYIMAKHSGKPEYILLNYIGIFNPRMNAFYRYDMGKLPVEIVKEIEEEIIGY